jgi:CysZ protein
VNPPPDRSTPVRDFVKGIGLFGRGLGIMLRRPRLLLLGAVPAVLTALLLLGGMVALVYWIDDVATFVTPFADDWSDALRAAVRVAVGVALVAAALVIGVVSFSAVTIAVGGPFYEHIAEKIEDELDGPPVDVELSWGRLLWLGIRDGVRLVTRSVVFTIPPTIAGFVPVLGQTVVPVVLMLITAWFLALELVAVPFYRRGMDLTQRREVMARRRALTVGFGLPAALLCAIPLLAIVVMPVAFAGGVLVAHEAMRDQAA